MSGTPVPGPVQQALDLLTSELKDVAFPGLEPRVLEAARRQVLTSAEKVAAAEKAWNEARAELGEAQDALLTKAQRAMAYAKIYAEDDPELAERIESIALPKGTRRPPRPEREATEASEIPSVPRRRSKARPTNGTAEERTSDDSADGVSAVA